MYENTFKRSRIYLWLHFSSCARYDWCVVNRCEWLEEGGLITDGLGSKEDG